MKYEDAKTINHEENMLMQWVMSADCYVRVHRNIPIMVKALEVPDDVASVKDAINSIVSSIPTCISSLEETC